MESVHFCLILIFPAEAWRCWQFPIGSIKTFSFFLFVSSFSLFRRRARISRPLLSTLIRTTIIVNIANKSEHFHIQPLWPDIKWLIHHIHLKAFRPDKNAPLWRAAEIADTLHSPIVFPLHLKTFVNRNWDLLAIQRDFIQKWKNGGVYRKGTVSNSTPTQSPPANCVGPR